MEQLPASIHRHQFMLSSKSHCMILIVELNLGEFNRSPCMTRIRPTSSHLSDTRLPGRKIVNGMYIYCWEYFGRLLHLSVVIILFPKLAFASHTHSFDHFHRFLFFLLGQFYTYLWLVIVLIFAVYWITSGFEWTKDMSS